MTIAAALARLESVPTDSARAMIAWLRAVELDERDGTEATYRAEQIAWRQYVNARNAADLAAMNRSGR